MKLESRNAIFEFAFRFRKTTGRELTEDQVNGCSDKPRNTEDDGRGLAPHTSLARGFFQSLDSNTSFSWAQHLPLSSSSGNSAFVWTGIGIGKLQEVSKLLD